MEIKLYSTVAIILCICFVQTCQSVSMKEYLKYNEVSDSLDTYVNGSDAIKDISPEFVEDVKFILEKSDDNFYMHALANLFDGKNAKITSATVKEHFSKEKAKAKTIMPMEYDICTLIDRMIVFPSMLLKELPAERVSGVVNVYYSFYGYGTDEDLEKALGYLYGTEPRPLAPNPVIMEEFSQKCTADANGTIPNEIHTMINRLKALNSTKLNPKVLQDLQIIADKFSFNVDIYQMIEFMERLMTNLNEKSSKNEICELKNQSSPWFEIFYNTHLATFKTIDQEANLETRVSKENYVDLMNLIRANWRIDGSDQEKALEYAYTPEYFNAEWCNQNVAKN